ncbi:hypothetical protein KEM52_005897, partial [Ascosphaera acerosa]
MPGAMPPSDVAMADVSCVRAQFSSPLRQGAHFADLKRTLDGVNLPPFLMNTRAELARRILRSLDFSQILYKLDWVDADQQAKLTKPKIRANNQAMLLAHQSVVRQFGMCLLQ